MKHYQSKTEDNWIELKPVSISDEQKNLLLSDKEEDAENKKALIDAIKLQKEGKVANTKVSKLKALYNGVKPSVKENQSYELIAVDVVEKTLNSYTGILNFRIDGKHQQIRF
jgi:hypothetical protein